MVSVNKFDIGEQINYEELIVRRSPRRVITAFRNFDSERSGDLGFLVKANSIRVTKYAIRTDNELREIVSKDIDKSHKSYGEYKQSLNDPGI